MTQNNKVLHQAPSHFLYPSTPLSFFLCPCSGAAATEGNTIILQSRDVRFLSLRAGDEFMSSNHEFSHH